MRTHILGFPSIGKQRELKQVLEAFWKGDLAAEALAETCTALKKRHWRIQQDAGLDYVTTGDFSLYDRMLDITRMLGAMPPASRTRTRTCISAWRAAMRGATFRPWK